jgi:hypothetical protein
MASLARFKKDTHDYWDRIIYLDRCKNAPGYTKDPNEKEEEKHKQFAKNIIVSSSSRKKENRVKAPANLPEHLKKYITWTKYDTIIDLYKIKGWELPNIRGKNKSKKKSIRNNKTLTQYQEEKTRLRNELKELKENKSQDSKKKQEELQERIHVIQMYLISNRQEQITIPKRKMNDFIYFMRLVFPDEYRKTYPGLTKLLDGLFKCGKTNNLLRRKGEATDQFQKTHYTTFNVISLYLLQKIEAKVKIIFAFEVDDFIKNGQKVEGYIKKMYEKSRCYDDRELFDFSLEFDTTDPKWMEQIKTWVVDQEFAYDNKIYEGEELKNFMGEEEE